MPSKAPGAHSSLMKGETDRPGERTRAREREKGGAMEKEKKCPQPQQLSVIQHRGIS